MKLVVASVIAAVIVGLASNSSDPALDAYTAKLQAGKSLKVEFTVSANGVKSICSLAYSSPNRLRIDTPDKLSVSDGTNLWVLNKADNTYTQVQAGTGPALADNVYAWRGFFAKEPFSDATDVTPGAKRTINGVDVQGYKLTLPKDKTATLYLETASGLAHGATVSVGDKTWTSLASKIDLSDTALPDSTFAFNPPDGAKKIEPPVVAAASFDAAEAVLKQYCTGCHGDSNPKAGLSLTSYAGIMAGSRGGRPVVVAGDPANSRLVKVLTGGTPKMPPGPDDVPADGVKAISDWIQAGAKSP